MYSRVSNSMGDKSIRSDPISSGDIILYSGGSFLDYIFLTENYSPIFCTIANNETDGGQVIYT